MKDEEIVALFFSRSERAIRELDKKYGRTCHAVSYGILGNRQDAEECVNDAYLGAWNAIPPARPNPLLAFVCRIVRNISLKRYGEKRAAKRDSRYDVSMAELEDCLAAEGTLDEEITHRELTRIIEAFLDTLSKENRVIFLRRYWFADTYADIARRVGLSEKNVSVRLVRMRKDLREYLLKRGVLL